MLQNSHDGGTRLWKRSFILTPPPHHLHHILDRLFLVRAPKIDAFIQLQVVIFIFEIYHSYMNLIIVKIHNFPFISHKICSGQGEIRHKGAHRRTILPISTILHDHRYSTRETRNIYIWSIKIKTIFILTYWSKYWSII